MSDSVDTQLFQVLRRQARQDRIVDRVLAECRLILFEAEAPQPTPDVHSGVLNSAGAQSSFRRNNVSRALFFATTAVRSFSSDRHAADAPAMSASPPIASELWHRSDPPLRAKRRHSHCSRFLIRSPRRRSTAPRSAVRGRATWPF